MKDSQSIVHRILHDIGHESRWTVGYKDRFKGIVESPFDSFNWRDHFRDAGHHSHQEGRGLAIPRHRIVYFKLDGCDPRDLIFALAHDDFVIRAIMWDRQSMTDLVTGGNATNALAWAPPKQCFDSKPSNAVPIFCELAVRFALQEPQKQAVLQLLQTSSKGDSNGAERVETQSMHVELCRVQCHKEEQLETAKAIFATLSNIALQPAGRGDTLAPPPSSTACCIGSIVPASYPLELLYCFSNGTALISAADRAPRSKQGKDFEVGSSSGRLQKLASSVAGRMRRAGLRAFPTRPAQGLLGCPIVNQLGCRSDDDNLGCGIGSAGSVRSVGGGSFRLKNLSLVLLGNEQQQEADGDAGGDGGGGVGRCGETVVSSIDNDSHLLTAPLLVSALTQRLLHLAKREQGAAGKWGRLVRELGAACGKGRGKGIEGIEQEEEKEQAFEGVEEQKEKAEATSVFRPMRSHLTIVKAALAALAARGGGEDGGQEVVVLRGLPGSGKSQMAGRLKGRGAAKGVCEKGQDVIVVSADDFFSQPKGKTSCLPSKVITPSSSTSSFTSATAGQHPVSAYTFSAGELWKAHRECMHSFVAALARGTRTVVLDNTNSQMWEYHPYLRLARLLGATTRVMEIACDGEATCARFQHRCTHGVPLAACLRMMRRWERDPNATIVPPTWGSPPLPGNAHAPSGGVTPHPPCLNVAKNDGCEGGGASRYGESCFPQGLMLAETRAAVAGSEEFVEIRQTLSARDDLILFDYSRARTHTFPDPELAQGGEPGRRAAQIRRECRGLVFSAATGAVVARRYHKFFNIGERPETAPEALGEDFLKQPHEVLVKLDGCLASPIMIGNKLRFATKRGFTRQSRFIDSFVDYAKTAGVDYAAFCRQQCLSGSTPLFEFLSRSLRLTVDYAKEALILTAVRDNDTGAYMPHATLQAVADAAGIPCVRAWAPPFSTIPSSSSSSFSTSSTPTFNAPSLQGLLQAVQGMKRVEGIVLRLSDGRTFKVKSDWYLQQTSFANHSEPSSLSKMLHRLKNGGSKTKGKFHSLASLLPSEKQAWRAVLKAQHDDYISHLCPAEAQTLKDFASDLLGQLAVAAAKAARYVATAKANGANKASFVRSSSARASKGSCKGGGKGGRKAGGKTVGKAHSEWLQRMFDGEDSASALCSVLKAVLAGASAAGPKTGLEEARQLLGGHVRAEWC